MSNYFGSSTEGDKYQTSFSKFPQYNVNTSHPLTTNSQEYMYYKKYVSIHSEDRDILHFPNSSEFEIEMPEDMLNVSAIRLIQWTFPANYNTFSLAQGNITLAFKIQNPYNPGANNISNDYAQKIFEALWYYTDKDFAFVIEEGFYNPQQMCIELTNKFNFRITNYLKKYFTEQGWTDALNTLEAVGGYNRFRVVYNNVSQKLWFGNIADGFTILSEFGVITNTVADTVCLTGKSHLPDGSNWGLPGYLGLSRCNTISLSNTQLNNISDYETVNGITVPRFYYGDVYPGDNGYWLLPDPNLTGSEVHWIEATFKINLMGEAFIYMELDKQNCIDETSPYNISKFTLQTNQTNGIVNSAFAKIPVPSTPLSQWFDRDAVPYKYYYPPAERIRKLKIKLRYHDGKIVSFGVFNYSFLLEFTLMVPQILRETKSVVFPPH